MVTASLRQLDDAEPATVNTILDVMVVTKLKSQDMFAKSSAFLQQHLHTMDHASIVTMVWSLLTLGHKLPQTITTEALDQLQGCTETLDAKLLAKLAYIASTDLSTEAAATVSKCVQQLLPDLQMLSDQLLANVLSAVTGLKGHKIELPGELLSEIGLRFDRADCDGLAALSVSLSKVPNPPANLVQGLLDTLQPKIKTMDADSVLTISHALLPFGDFKHSAMTALIEKISADVASFTTLQLISLADLYRVSPSHTYTIMVAIAAQLEKRIDGLSKSQMPHAYASIAKVCPSAPVLRTIEAEIEKKVAHFKVSDLLRTLWVIGKLSTSLPLLHKIIHACEKKLDNFETSELAQLASILGHLDLYAQGTFQKVAAEMERKIQSASSHDIAILLKGCARVHFHSPSLVSKSVNAAKIMLNRFDANDLACLISALASLNYNSQPVWQKVEAAAEKVITEEVDTMALLAAGLSAAGRDSKIVEAVCTAAITSIATTRNWSVQSLTKLASALAASNIRTETLWKTLIQHLMEKHTFFCPRALSDVTQALAAASPDSADRNSLVAAICRQADLLSASFQARDFALLGESIFRMKENASTTYDIKLNMLLDQQLRQFDCA